MNTSAKKGTSQNRSGGYFAIDVVVQEVSAKIVNTGKSNSMSVTAGGNIVVSSTAKAQCGDHSNLRSG